MAFGIRLETGVGRSGLIGLVSRALLLAMSLTSLGAAAAAQTTTYSYDVHGRLLQAVTGFTTSAYTYDAADNRSSAIRTMGGSEVTSMTFSASSNYADYTGLTTPGGMRDANFISASSIHGTNYEVDAWIQADLGSNQAVSRIDVAPADQSAPGGWGAPYLNGARVEYSTNGSSWTTVATISGAVDGSYSSISLGGATVRYIRIRMDYFYLGMGDFRVFGA